MEQIETIQMPFRDGFRMEAVIVWDYDCHPNDFDCYDADQIAAFDAGDWCYVGVIVRAMRGDHEVGSASLWGVDYGLGPSGSAVPKPDEFSYARYDVPAELAPEAVEHAWSNVDRMIEAAALLAH